MPNKLALAGENVLVEQPHFLPDKLASWHKISLKKPFLPSLWLCVSASPCYVADIIR
jgi:hypothetical protein